MVFLTFLFSKEFVMKVVLLLSLALIVGIAQAADTSLEKDGVYLRLVGPTVTDSETLDRLQSDGWELSSVRQSTPGDSNGYQTHCCVNEGKSGVVASCSSFNGQHKATYCQSRSSCGMMTMLLSTLSSFTNRP